MQFTRVAHATDFIYCYTILETNKRAENTRSGAAHATPHHRQSNVPTMTTEISNQMFILPVNAELNTFFPFDPYRLSKSNAFIQGVYREWSSVAIEDEVDEEDEEEELKERDELNIPRDKENDGSLGESLGAMSISPLAGC